MSFVVVEKDSLDKSIVSSSHVVLSEASIIHTKMDRDDVTEFVRDGNNLILKLKNGKTIVIENFFEEYEGVDSDLVFEEDGCALFVFDGVSGFNGIPGMEVLLPEIGNIAGLWPWLAGVAIGGGLIASSGILSGGGGGGDMPTPTSPRGPSEPIPAGIIEVDLAVGGDISGTTVDIAPGNMVSLTVGFTSVVYSIRRKYCYEYA